MQETIMENISFETFMSVDIRAGQITKAEPFPRAKNPSYKVWVDFGPEIGIKQTSAQITHHYTPETLLGKWAMGCINLGPRNIAGFQSEFLLLGFHDGAGAVCLGTMAPQPVLGARMA
jgi:tRNA-binding protein